MKLIVGLGNPGSAYTWTRHNLGFLVVDAIAQEYGIKFKKSGLCNGLEAKAVIDSVVCLLLKPTTFMNLSGIAVQQFVVEKEISLNDLLILSDDLALPFGQLRIRPHGSDGGHNGLTSIIDQLASKDFARLRLGISRPRLTDSVVDYVLANFTAGEQKLLPEFIKHGQNCVVSWATKGVVTTMKDYNKKEGA